MVYLDLTIFLLIILLRQTWRGVLLKLSEMEQSNYQLIQKLSELQISQESLVSTFISLFSCNDLYIMSLKM